ncbi:MAG: acyltransferase [Burkholderiaceae bacterium]
MFVAIEGVRALGALSVATNHGWNTLIKELPWFKGSFLVVEMFFVLSGYLLTRFVSPRLHGPADTVAEIIRRLGRLYPLHIVVLFAWIGILYGKQLAVFALAASGIDLHSTPIADQNHFDLEYFILNLLMLHGLGIENSDLFNYPAWSISVEFWSFVIVASVLTLFRRPKSRRLAMAALLALCFLQYLSVWIKTGNPQAPSTPLVEKLITRGLLAYLCGALAAELQSAIAWRPTPMTLNGLQLLLATGIPWAVANQAHLPMSQATIPILWAALFVSLASDRGWLSRALSVAPLVWIGRRSFALYISHALVLLLVDHRMSMITNPWLSLLGWAATIGTALMLADWLHRHVEKQGFEIFKRLAERALDAIARRGKSRSPDQGPEGVRIAAPLGAHADD